MIIQRLNSLGWLVACALALATRSQVQPGVPATVAQPAVANTLVCPGPGSSFGIDAKRISFFAPTNPSVSSPWLEAFTDGNTSFGGFSQGVVPSTVFGSGLDHFVELDNILSTNGQGFPSGSTSWVNPKHVVAIKEGQWGWEVYFRNGGVLGYEYDDYGFTVEAMADAIGIPSVSCQ